MEKLEHIHVQILFSYGKIKGGSISGSHLIAEELLTIILTYVEDI